MRSKLKQLVLQKIEEKKKQGIREIPLNEFVKEIVMEGYSLTGAYNSIRELEILGKIKVVYQKGKKKILLD